MRRLVLRCCAVLLVSMFAITSCWAQTAAAGATATVPPLVKVSGTLANAQGTVGVTFALYAEQTGGAPLWLETQNVTPDANGRYTVYLGANHANGVPLNLFASGEARWLGVQPEGQPEQARAQLVSVPYALTAGDAQTLGGQPLSAFVLTSAVNGGTTTSGGTTASAGSSSIVALATPQAGGTPVTTNSGTTGYLAKFTSTAGDIENSLVYDTGTAVGIGTTAPASALHVSTTVPPAAYFDVYSGSPTTVLNIMPTVNRAARGTPTNPSAVQLNDYIAGMAARGYGSTKFANGGRAALRMQASENWTDTNQGTYMSFWTSATGSTVSVEHMRLDPLGNVGIGTQTPTSPLTVAGTIQSTTGGFKFPDNTVLTSAANLASGSGLTTTVVNGATTVGVDTSVLQKRVSGNCPSGAISQINQDGTVTCVGVGGSSGAQTGYFTAYVNAPLNAAASLADSYRIPLDQAITVTSLSVTTAAPLADANCAPPLIALVDSTGAIGRDLVLQAWGKELDSDSESIPFSKGAVLRLATSQGLFCPSTSTQAATSYKVVVRYRPTTAVDTAQCAAGTTSCNGYCADTSTSVQNCGACGNVCPSTATSTAVCLTGQCHKMCAAGAAMCDGTCTNTSTDPTNCGSCGSSCGPGYVCSNGSCTSCPNGATACNGSCCSAGQVCGPKAVGTGKFAQIFYQVCISSCPTGMTACNGQCVDLTSNTLSCGSCNNSCQSIFISGSNPGSCFGAACGALCYNSKCVCPDGNPPSCTYTQPGFGTPFYTCASPTNVNACGKCGVTCATGQICSAGKCVTCASGVVCNGACCSAGQVCQGAEKGAGFEYCQPASQACPLGQTYCASSNGCVDTNSDKFNCGGCNNRCDSYMGNQANMACVQGQCQLCYGIVAGVSPTSYTKPLSCWTNFGSYNAYACTALGPNNCGGCGTTCTTGTACLVGTDNSGRPSANCCPSAASAFSNGICQCPSGTTWCGNACVNTQTDSNNCSACGIYCSAGSGMYCWNGKCTSCPNGQSYCNGSCTNSQTDSNNCGTCGKVCPSGQYCYSGACAAPVTCPSGQFACNNVCTNLNTDVNHCGNCNSWCPAGTGVYCSGGQCGTCSGTICGSTCTSVNTDPNNCGTCGHACASGQTCAGGTCQSSVSCSGSTSNCNNNCVDKTSDNNNCGFCGHACPSGSACLAGACQTCASSQTICNGACTNLQTSSVNCGSCGNACSNGEVCTAGKCGCPGGTISCGSTCAAVLIDPTNCGKCGTVCPVNQQCYTGKCNPLCASPNMACDGACVDVTADAANCGSCGMACDTGWSCGGDGMCNPPPSPGSTDGTASTDPGSADPGGTDPGSEAGAGGVNANARRRPTMRKRATATKPQ